VRKVLLFALSKKCGSGNERSEVLKRTVTVTVTVKSLEALYLRGGILTRSVRTARKQFEK
jgi:hypothetical protein